MTLCCGFLRSAPKSEPPCIAWLLLARSDSFVDSQGAELVSLRGGVGSSGWCRLCRGKVGLGLGCELVIVASPSQSGGDWLRWAFCFPVSRELTAVAFLMLSFLWLHCLRPAFSSPSLLTSAAQRSVGNSTGASSGQFLLNPRCQRGSSGAVCLDRSVAASGTSTCP